jgi:hypothetical protein
MEINTERLYGALLEVAVNRDGVTARRKLLVDLLSQERFLDRSDLIARVEMVLGKGSFGDAAWEDVFYRDMRVVKKSFRAAGVELAYSRTKGNAGYYLRGEGEFNPKLAQQIRSAAAEVDPQQTQITQTLSPAERVQQGFSITHLAHQVTGYRQTMREEAHA